MGWFTDHGVKKFDDQWQFFWLEERDGFDLPGDS
jgi:hypothetical protein